VFQSAATRTRSELRKPNAPVIVGTVQSGFDGLEGRGSSMRICVSEAGIGLRVDEAASPDFGGVPPIVAVKARMGAHDRINASWTPSQRPRNESFIDE
jgi:hypothetical protein